MVELVAKRVIYTVTDSKVGAEKNFFYLKEQGYDPVMEEREFMDNPPRLQGKYVVWFRNRMSTSPISNSPKPQPEKIYMDD